MDELRKIAEAATPGPWEHHRPPWDGTIHALRAEGRRFARMEDTGYSPESSWDQRAADAEFIATFDPVVVGRLLDVVDAARQMQRRTQGTGFASVRLAEALAALTPVDNVPA